MDNGSKEIKLFTMEFYIAREKTFCVTVKGWNTTGFNGMDFENPVEKFNWNVYASIYEGHPLFNGSESDFHSLPFHGGCTYDKIIKTSPSQGIKYDFEKETTTLKLGSDYAHLGDYENHQSPIDGIPYYIERDAKALSDALLKALDQ